MNFAHTPDAVYITPPGRRCRWVAPTGNRETWSYAMFVYLDARSRAMADGFVLTDPNFRILRREAAHAPRR